MPELNLQDKEARMFAENAIRDIMHGQKTFQHADGSTRKYDVNDILRSKDLAPLTSEAISRVLVDEIEPDSIIYDTLFQEIGITKGGTFQFTTTGELVAGPVSEDGEYPETNFTYGVTGYRINIQMQKYGLAIRVANDVLEDNMIDVVGMWLRKAQNALVRNREKMAFNEIKKYGIIEFNNAAPGAGSGPGSDTLTTTGRGIDGVQNGTFCLNDMMELYTRALVAGYTLDTLLMHPFAWQMFMVDPEMKEIIMANNTVVTYRPPNGNLFNKFKFMEGPDGLGLTWGKGQGQPTLNPANGKLTPNPFVQTMLALGATLNLKPNHWPTPLTLVVTPYVPISKVGEFFVTDLIFAQSAEAGVVFRKEDPIVDRINNEEKEHVLIRMKETFGMGVMNQGKGIRIAKNIVVARNYVFENVNMHSLNALTRYSALSGTDRTTGTQYT